MIEIRRIDVSVHQPISVSLVFNVVSYCVVIPERLNISGDTAAKQGIERQEQR